MRHAGTQPIETERLLLRRYTAEDAPAIYAGWTSDPEVPRWMMWEAHKSVEETREQLAGWLESYKKPDYYAWGIQRKSDGVLMGAIGVSPSIEALPAGWEPGYCIGRAFWNRGYTTEALRAVVPWFCESTGAHTLYCCHALGNPASGRVMEKAGFVYRHDGAYEARGVQVPAKMYVYTHTKTREDHDG